MSSQRQPRLGITNTARTTSNTVPMAQNTWQGRTGVSQGAALVHTVCNSRAAVDKVLHVGARILDCNVHSVPKMNLVNNIIVSKRMSP